MKDNIIKQMLELDGCLGYCSDGVIFTNGTDFFAVKPVKKKRVYSVEDMERLATPSSSVEKDKKTYDENLSSLVEDMEIDEETRKKIKEELN